MSDVNKMMSHPEINDPVMQDRLDDLSAWNEEQGKALAAEEGLELTPEHWEVLNFLRNYYLEHGKARNARVLGDALEEEFKDAGGRKHLYRLFPKGPVAQGSRIAGLPLPEYSEDPSFGSAQ